MFGSICINSMGIWPFIIDIILSKLSGYLALFISSSADIWSYLYQTLWIFRPVCTIFYGRVIPFQIL